MEKDSTPTRPRNIIAMMIPWLSGDKPVVIPMVSPTVPMAEATSKAAAR